MSKGEAINASRAAANTTPLQFPSGLLGFESVKEFALLTSEEEEPFSWLQAVNDATLAFLVVPPFLVVPEYEPDIPAEDARSLGLQKPEDAWLFNIVTLRGNQGATVNLKGPLVINRHTLQGKQVVLANALKYSVQHPLAVEG